MRVKGFSRIVSIAGTGACLLLAVLASTQLTAAESRPSAEKALAVAIPIDSENLIDLYQSVPDLRIIDARLRADHRLGHIELSANLPINELDCETLARFADDEDTAMVFYCNGRDGKASIGALEVASACGYRRLFWLRGGFIEWQDKDYPFVVE